MRYTFLQLNRSRLSLYFFLSMYELHDDDIQDKTQTERITENDRDRVYQKAINYPKKETGTQSREGAQREVAGCLCPVYLDDLGYRGE
jgi:hypothetical protein